MLNEKPRKKKFVLKKQDLTALTKADLNAIAGAATRLPDTPRNPWTPGTSTCPGG